MATYAHTLDHRGVIVPASSLTTDIAVAVAKRHIGVKLDTLTHVCLDCGSIGESTQRDTVVEGFDLSCCIGEDGRTTTVLFHSKEDLTAR